MNTVTFRRYDATAARDLRGMVAQIHDDAYAERINSGDSFDTTEAFMRRFDAYTSREGFDLVVAYYKRQPGRAGVGLGA